MATRDMNKLPKGKRASTKTPGISAAAKRVGMRVIGKREALARGLSKSHHYVDYDGLAIPYKKGMSLAKDMDTTLKAREKGLTVVSSISKKLKSFFTPDKPTFKNLGLRDVSENDKRLFTSLINDYPWLVSQDVPDKYKRNVLTSINALRNLDGVKKNANLSTVEKYILKIQEGHYKGRDAGYILYSFEYEDLNKALKHLGISPKDMKMFKEELISP